MLKTLSVSPSREKSPPRLEPLDAAELLRALSNIHQSLEPDVVISLALTSIANLVHAEMGGAVFIAPTRQALHARYSSALAPAVAREIDRLTLDPRLAELIRAEDRDSILRTLEEWISDLLPRLEIYSFALFPLAAHRRALGLLFFFNPPGESLHPLDETVAQTLAEHTALALDNAHAYARERDAAEGRRNQAMEGLTRLSVELTGSRDPGAIADLAVEWAKKLLHTPAASIRLLDSVHADSILAPPRARATLLRGDELKWFLEKRTAYAVQDVEREDAISPATRERLRGQGMRALLSVPMTARDRIIGVLSVSDTAARGWHAREIDLLQTLANQSANALQSAELFQDVVAEQRRIQAILDSGLSALYATDKDERFILFNHAAEQMSGWTLLQVLGKTWNETLGRAQKNAPPLMRETLRDGRSLRVLEGRELITRDGRVLPVAETVAPLVDNHGHVTGAVGAFWDLSREKQAERTREFFLRMVAHELRTPITKILSAAGLVNNSRLSRQRRAEMWLVVENAARGLKNLADQFLDLEGREQASRPVQIEKIVLVSFAREMVNERRALARTHRLVIAPAPKTLAVYADRQRLEHVFRNLLDNAVKYSPPKSRITITIKSAGKDRAQVEVEDQGAGIPPPDRELIFKAFYRAQNVAGVRGHGMGLAIAREMIRDMGGTIEADGRRGRGAILRFTLRRAG